MAEKTMTTTPPASVTPTPPVLEAEDLHVHFAARGRKGRVVRAVNGVSLQIARGETLGLVGESGSGKSTVGRALLRLIDSNSGTIRLHGQDITKMTTRELRPLRGEMQMVSQDPYTSLDPSMVVADSVAEPLRVHTTYSRREIEETVAELFQKVGLAPYHLQRFPYEFSGGQRQRIAIARAIAVNPTVAVLDEAVSALDVSTQNQIIELIESLRGELGLAYLFISHDLAVVSHISHRVAVMYLGNIVEIGAKETIFESPAHPYTQSLLSAVPVPDPVRQKARERIRLTGELPDPTDVPTGCPFRTRCASAMEICKVQTPAMRPLGKDRVVACHLYPEVPSEGSTS